MTPEGALLKQILDYLAAERIWAMRINTGAVVSEYKGCTRFHRYGRPGCADIMVWYKDQLWWLECKTPKGHQSDLQKQFELEVQRAGMGYFVVRSLDDVKEALR